MTHYYEQINIRMYTEMIKQQLLSINVRKDIANLLLRLLDTDISETRKDEVEKELETLTEQVGEATVNEWVDEHYHEC